VCYHPPMKRASATLLLLFGLLIVVYGCSMNALPTPTPIAPVATPTVESTQTALPTDTAVPPTSTEVPPSPTATPESTTTATEERVSTPEPTVAPRPTRMPAEPTATVEEGTGGVEATPTVARPRPPTPTAEPAPAGGWSEVVRGYPGKKRVALTFDAGDKGEAMPAILAALRERNIHITMFFTGKYAERYSEGVKQAVADGHEIANHTYSHRDSREITDDELIEELARTERILYEMTGVSTKPYWRPPFGGRNNHVLNVAVNEGYRSIYWTLDSLDSVGQPKTPDFIFNRVTNTPDFNLDGAIILQHFGSQASADALPRILDRLQEMGYSVVTVSDILTP
jgi:peptidoglycan-N-acetylmuramic acid deacetylase